MLIILLFIIAKLWNHSRCPSTDEIKKMVYIGTTEFYSTRKNEIKSFPEKKRMKLGIIIVNEITVSERQIACFLSS